MHFPRNGQPFLAVYLDSPRRNFARVLQENGLFDSVRMGTVTYSAPSFVPHGLALTCGSDPDFNSESARRIIQKLRQFSTRVDSELAKLVQAGAWDQYRLVSKRQDREEMKSEFLVHNVGGQRIPDVTEALARDYAAHSLLVDDPEHYALNDDAISGKFSVRPIDAVTRFERVRNLVRERAPEVLDFAKRAAVIREWGRVNRPVGITTTTKLPRLELPPNLEWANSDMLFLRFLRESVDEQRVVQIRPAVGVVAGILKIVDESARNHQLPHARPALQDREAVYAFLSDVGAAAPWENWVAHEEDGLYAEWDGRNLYVPSVKTDVQLTGDLHESVRRDFGRLPVYTIDDSGAKELDDGISIEPAAPTSSGTPTWWVHVHVADPTAVLPPSHAIALLAKERDHTEYFPEKTWSMLPSWFMKRNGMSLGEAEKGSGGEQRVLTFSSRIDETGDVLDTDVQPAVVRNVRPLTYAAVDATFGYVEAPRTVLYNAVLPPEFDLSVLRGASRTTDDALLKTDVAAHADLATLHSLATALSRRRVSNNALVWFNPQATVSVSPQLSHHHILSPTPVFYSTSPLISLTTPSPTYASPAQLLVSEHMVAANRAAAKFCASRGLPAPFRSQAAPTASQDLSGSLESVMAARDPITGLVPVVEILRNGVEFGPGGTTIDPKEHWTMGILDESGYIKATSPLRRYSDLLAHWQIKGALLPRRLRASGPTIPRRQMIKAVQRIDEVQGSRGRLSKHAEAFWAMYLLREKLLAPPEADLVAAELLGRLTARAVKPVVYTEYTGEWTQGVWIGELGVKAQLVVGGPGEAPGVGEEVGVSVTRVEVTNRARALVELRK